MLSLFVENPFQYLEKKSDELGNSFALCPYRGWVLLTNKPEEIVRIYLLNLLKNHFEHILFEPENAVRSDISCYIKHPDTLHNFTYKLRPFAIWEIKRIDGSSFSNTLRQINGYIQVNKLKYGAFFYNCLEMGHVDWNGNTKQINSIEDLEIVFNEFLASCNSSLYPIYQCYNNVINSAPINTFDNIIVLINILSDANLTYLFKGKPTFHILIDDEDLFLENLEYDIENDYLIKYKPTDNYVFYRSQKYKFLGIS